MYHRFRTWVLATAAVLVFAPGAAFAQVGNIDGVVRDSDGGVLPGVLVEAESPQLIRARSTVTDSQGRYQIPSLSVGVYRVRFTLNGFTTVERTNIELSSDATATINVTMSVGARTEVVEVVGELNIPLVDVRNVQQRQVFSGDDIVDLPTTRNLGDLVQLVPGIAIAAQGGGLSEATICSGGQGQGQWGGSFSGCSPIMTGFNAHSSMNDGDSINQGRMQVDGLGVQSFGGGGRSNYIADVGNAQEVVFTLSGSLGESETGGTTINVVPRTGGNRYAGNYFTAYGGHRFFDRNDSRRPSNFSNRLQYEYDLSGSYGGPIIRNRLWFYSSARRQDRESILVGNYRNLNEGIFGANYVYDPARQVMSSDLYQNVSTRLTLQATRRDKFNLFWDEQYTCESPCRGGGIGTSLEATSSPVSSPLHLAQASWTNPLTNRILLEAGVSHYSSRRNETQHYSLGRGYPEIPRINESGASTSVVPGALINSMTSGSINNALYWRIQNWQGRASASYISGSHNVKFGYQGQLLQRVSSPANGFNDLRMLYTYQTPAAGCNYEGQTFGAVTTAAWCGLFPDGVTRVFDGRHVSEPIDPECENLPNLTAAQNTTRRTNCPTRLQTSDRPPQPTSFTQYIPGGSHETGFFNAFYLQDQWTWKRLTLNGALRYDNAQSRFGETCIGPDVFTDYSFCLNEGGSRGVSFHNITPRGGVAWDIFGTGKTALKWSIGQYLQGSHINIGSIYVATNPASGGRTTLSITRTWRDLNGDRIVDCDLKIPEVAPTNGFPANGECAAFTNIATARRFGRAHTETDGDGNPIGLTTMYCGQEKVETSASPSIQNYCANYYAAGGTSLLEGWNKRQYEWQHSIGVQHQLLPRLTAEVTFNHRTKRNQTVTDALNAGCDLYSPVAVGEPSNYEACNQGLLNFQSDYYDFYGVQAPLDPRLPGGGGYVVMGRATPKCDTYSTQPNMGHVCESVISVPAASGGSAVTRVPHNSLPDYWRGIDTNFVWRPRAGLRMSGGTSTGKRYVENCAFLLGGGTPTGQVLMEGRERSCARDRNWQTNMRGTASYTIPWVDVLLSSAISARPGVERQANYQVDMLDLVWAPGSQDRTATVFSNNLTSCPDGVWCENLLSNDLFGERIILVDLKLAKNIRFLNKRANIGADIYNVFNSDAARGYCNTFPNPDRDVHGCGNANIGWTDWGAVTNIVTPRYARFQLQFHF